MVSGAALLAALAAAGPVVAAEKRIGLSSFDRIVLNGDFVVEVSTRAPLGAVVSGSSDGLDRVEIRNVGGVLTINDRRYGSDRQRGAGPGAITIRINTAGLRSAAVAGAGSLTIDRMKGAKVDLGLRGPGTLVVGAIAADRLTLAVVGNGRAVLAGTTKTAEAMVSGAGAVDAAALNAADLVVQGEGSADQRYAASRSAQLTLRGTGRMTVTGKAKCVVRNLGSVTVACGS